MIPSLCVFCWEKIFRPQQITYPSEFSCHVFASGIYDDMLKKILILAKFKHHRQCIEFLIELVLKTFATIPWKVDCITSVPSSYWRSLKRGVDLPATLAFELSKKEKIPYQPSLIKKRRRADRQSKLGFLDRKSNVTKLFRADPSIRGKTILVIDDIVTTGSTIRSCYRAMKRHKPKQVIFLTCAKTRF